MALERLLRLVTGKAYVEGLDAGDTAHVPGGLQVDGATALTGAITPATIAANQNDYSPTGLAAAVTLRLEASAAVNVTGLAGGAAGRVLSIYNASANAITLTAEDAASSAANRFGFQTNLILGPSAGCVLQYDSTASRWRLIGASRALTQDLVSSSTLTTTTSAADVLISGLTLTPAAGTYLVWLSGDFTNTSNNSDVILSIYAGGAQAADSERTLDVSRRDRRRIGSTTARVTVNGAQAIEARWRRTSGTAEARGRSLMILKVA